MRHKLCVRRAQECSGRFAFSATGFERIPVTLRALSSLELLQVQVQVRVVQQQRRRVNCLEALLRTCCSRFPIYRTGCVSMVPAVMQATGRQVIWK
jgi:hypothetical protein